MNAPSAVTLAGAAALFRLLKKLDAIPTVQLAGKRREEDGSTAYDYHLGQELILQAILDAAGDREKAAGFAAGLSWHLIPELGGFSPGYTGDEEADGAEALRCVAESQAGTVIVDEAKEPPTEPEARDSTAALQGATSFFQLLRTLADLPEVLLPGKRDGDDDARGHDYYSGQEFILGALRHAGLEIKDPALAGGFAAGLSRHLVSVLGGRAIARDAAEDAARAIESVDRAKAGTPVDATQSGRAPDAAPDAPGKEEDDQARLAAISQICSTMASDILTALFVLRSDQPQAPSLVCQALTRLGWMAERTAVIAGGKAHVCGGADDWLLDEVPDGLREALNTRPH